MAQDPAKRRSDPEVRVAGVFDYNQTTPEPTNAVAVSTTLVDALITGTDEVLPRKSLPVCASAPSMISSPPTSPKASPTRRHSMLAAPAVASGFLAAASRGSFVGVAAVRDQVVSFYDVFGYLGIASIIAFVFSALWTLMLAVIQIYPNEMANSIMKTTEFDNGDFWLLPQPDTPIVVSAVVLLVLFAFGYFALAVFMLVGLRNIHQPLNPPSSLPLNAVLASQASNRNKLTEKLKVAFLWLKQQFTNPTPIRRHYFVRACDISYLDQLSLS